MDYPWDTHILTEVTLGNGSERFPVTSMRVYAPDARAAAITTHVCYLALINGNGRKFRVGPKWWAMVERHGIEIEHRVD